MDLWIPFKIAAELILPPTGFVTLAFVGLLLRQRHPRLALTVGAASLSGAYLMMLPVVGWQLDRLDPNRAEPAPVAMPWPEAEAVVILGGGRRSHAPEFGKPVELSASTLERVRYGAYVARLTGAPILVSGGAPGWAPEYPEARLMAETLDREFRLPVRWIEDQSKDTAENAARSSAILRDAGVRSIYLVTHANHLARAGHLFESHGLRVIPLGTGYTPIEVLSAWHFLPSMNGLAGNRWRLEAWVGRLINR